MGKPNIRTKRKVVAALKKHSKNMDEWVRPISNTRRFNASGVNSFLLGVMFDRSIPADRAWESGEWINESLGDHQDVTVLWNKLVSMEKKRLTGFLKYGYGGMAFHRHYKTFAKQLPRAAKVILDKYDGDPRNIWNTERDVDVIRNRLEEIPGIGSALSRMTVLILARNYGLIGGKASLPQLDIKPDIHVMRVFRRSGLIDSKAIEKDAIETARQLNPQFPAVLDAPCFEIGQKWCRPSSKKCEDCPITEACPKLRIVDT